VRPLAGFRRLTDVGINDGFMKELDATMTPGGSTLFVLVTKATPGKVLEELKGTGGRVLKTSLSDEDEAKSAGCFECSKIVEAPQTGIKWRPGQVPDGLASPLASDRLDRRLAIILARLGRDFDRREN
jgi:hypothetical protein